MCGPSLNRRERLRRVVILCRDFTRNPVGRGSWHRRTLPLKGPMPERQKAGAWKLMKTLRMPAALASSNHVFNSFICASYWGRSASHDDGER
jgi:hypothetical protein